MEGVRLTALRKADYVDIRIRATRRKSKAYERTSVVMRCRIVIVRPESSHTSGNVWASRMRRSASRASSRR